MSWVQFLIFIHFIKININQVVTILFDLSREKGIGSDLEPLQNVHQVLRNLFIKSLNS